MYLDVADSGNLPYGWSRYAHFSLAVVNQVHSKYSVRKGTKTCKISYGVNPSTIKMVYCMHVFLSSFCMRIVMNLTVRLMQQDGL